MTIELNRLIALVLLGALSTLSLQAQNEQQYAQELFRGTRVVNGHSVQTLHDGEMEMIIGHRFGRLNGGAYELFGLDQANIRLGLDYGVKNWLLIGAGRSSLNKELDGFVKVRLLRQGAFGQGGFPLSVTAISSTSYKTLRAPDPEKPLAWQNRMAFVHQVLLARKVNDRLTFQVMPTLAHYNLVDSAAYANDRLALGVAGKYQLSKNWAITSEYYYVYPDHLPPGGRNPFSIGIDLNTGSHVFQLHFTNAAGMIEKQFIGETNGNWADGDIQFGFNMVRTFKLKGRRY